MANVRVNILGSRGSIPVSGAQFSRYGGATCCVVVRTADSLVVLDAGTGLLSLSSCLRQEHNIPIFLSHCHVDHILGLPLCSEMFRPEFNFRIFGTSRDGKNIGEQVGTLLSPPLWPVGPHDLPADITFHELPPSVAANGITVESMEGCHPGGVSVFRLTAEGRRIVYLTDCTITEENRDRLLEFSRDCDILLCDGQYSDAQWLTCSTFGHNRWTEAARFGAKCGAKHVRILHHSPSNTDQILEQVDLQVRNICPVCSLAFDGEEITL